MTQAEIDILNAQKQQATDILQQIVNDKHAMEHDYWTALDGCDTRIREYVEHVAYNPDQHGLQEQCVVIRYFRLVRTYTFKKKEVKRFIYFAERIPQEGVTHRQPYKLTPVQCFIAANIFGLWTEKQGCDDVRMTRTAMLLVARKFSKTGFACLIMTYFFIIFGDDSSEIYIGANSSTQANVAFREVSAQIANFDEHCREKNNKAQYIRITNDEIAWKELPDQQAHRKIGKLTSTSGTKDGLKPELGYIDEYAAAKDKPSQPGDALRNVIESGMGNRRQPLILITTTAGTVLDGPCIKEVEAYHDILLQELTEPDTSQDKVFPFLAQPDAGDDIHDPRTWRKAQPHLGVTVFEDFYKEQIEKAQLTHSYMMEFMTKNLNLFIRDESNAWFTLEQANALMDKDSDLFADVSKMSDMVCALDLMETGDMCAVCYFGFDVESSQFRAHLEYYMPEDCIDTHPNKFLYREWAEQGYLNLTKGRVIDSNRIADDIVANGERLQGKLKRIRYDAAYSKDFCNRMKTHAGVPPEALMPVPQTILNYNQAMQYFDIIRDDPAMGGIKIDYNPILAWNLCNCVIMTNHNGLRMPDKGRGADKKIDGADALLMCVFDAQEGI